MRDTDYNLYSMHAHGVDRPKIPIRIYHRKHSQNSPVPMHSHDFLEIALVLSGSATHTIRTPEGKDSSYPIRSGDVFVIVPGQNHGFSFQSEESIEITNILFNHVLVHKIAGIDEDQINFQEFLNKLSQPVRAKTSPLHLKDEAMARICTLVSNIEHKAIQRTTGYSTMILLYFSVILSLLFRYYKEQGTDHEEVVKAGLVTQILQYINQHYQEEITLLQLSELTHFSTRQITRRFKQAVGISISEYVLSQRMNHARELLSTTGMRITDIALEVGFNNPSYFCEQFHKVMGCTPNQFRNGEVTKPKEQSP